MFQLPLPQETNPHSITDYYEHHAGIPEQGLQNGILMQGAFGMEGTGSVGAAGHLVIGKKGRYQLVVDNLQS